MLFYNHSDIFNKNQVCFGKLVTVGKMSFLFRKFMRTEE